MNFFNPFQFVDTLRSAADIISARFTTVVGLVAKPTIIISVVAPLTKNPANATGPGSEELN